MRAWRFSLGRKRKPSKAKPRVMRPLAHGAWDASSSNLGRTWPPREFISTANGFHVFSKGVGQ